MPVIDPPTLRDGDLTLRPPRLDDADAVTAACQDPEIARWTGVPSPYRREHAIEYLGAAAGHARAGESAHFLGFAEGRLVASASIMELDFERGYGEIGYWVAAAARRRSFATRTVRLLRDYGHGTLGLTTIEILVHPDNVPSQKVAEGAGFTATDELRAPPKRLERGGDPELLVYVARPEGVTARPRGS